MLSSNSIELREWSIKIPIIITLSFDMTLPHFRQTTTKVKQLESWENITQKVFTLIEETLYTFSCYFYLFLVSYFSEGT